MIDTTILCSMHVALVLKITFTSDSSQNDNNDKSKISSMFFEMMRNSPYKAILFLIKLQCCAI